MDIYTLNASELNVNEYEALRYLGYMRSAIADEDIAMVRQSIEEIRTILAPKACYERYKINIDGDRIEMPYGVVDSKDLATNLRGCQEIYIFAATIGPRFDMTLVRTRQQSIAKAAVLQSVGAASVEALCDTLNEELRQKALNNGERLHPRYSPGFGDLGLENQRGVFSVLRPEKNIGLTLKDNLIMAPEKSVTAIIGIDKN